MPFYKKRLYNAFYPYTNGEKDDMIRSLVIRDFFDEKCNFLFKIFIEGYKKYVKRRGFKAFMLRDSGGRYISIKESSLLYSFETYIQALLQATDGKSYREADTGLGKSDLIINVKGNEYLLESKIYYYELQFTRGKAQLAYDAKSLGLCRAVYLVFHTNKYPLPEEITEQDEVFIETFLIKFDETK